jgi:hypothetical protein
MGSGCGREIGSGPDAISGALVGRSGIGAEQSTGRSGISR